MFSYFSDSCIYFSKLIFNILLGKRKGVGVLTVKDSNFVSVKIILIQEAFLLKKICDRSAEKCVVSSGKLVRCE